jgi:uncharacterized protein
MPPETERLRDQLRAMLPELAAKYGVAELGVFGSRVRGDHRPDSDLDVLVTFHDDEKVTADDIFGLEDALADGLGVRIDLAIKKNLRSRLRPYILHEVQRV